MSGDDSRMEFKDCQKKQLQDFAVKMLPSEYAQAQAEEIEVEITEDYA